MGKHQDVEGIMETGNARAMRARLIVVIAVGILVFALALIEALAEREPDVDSGTPWKDAIETVDAQLQRRDISGAAHAWRDAYLAAFDSRRWDGMMEVGDAALRLGVAAPPPRLREPRAREFATHWNNQFGVNDRGGVDPY